MSDRTFILHTPVDDDMLRFCQGHGTEALSDLTLLDIEMISPSPDLEATDFLGKNFTLEIVTQSGNSRFIDAIVSHFTFQGLDVHSGNEYRYKARLQSWLFLADKTSDYRIYQQKTVPDIVTEALSDFGMPFEFDLAESYGVIPYSVMYAETVLNYVKRMTELVGIYWYIRHEMGSHTIVFTDRFHKALTDYDQICYLSPEDAQQLPDADEYITSWEIENQLTSGKHTTRSYNFHNPKASLEAEQSMPKDHANDALEMFEYAGFYDEWDEGEKLVQIRREQQQLNYEIISGNTTVRGFAPGYTFNLLKHPREKSNRQYLIIITRYSFVENSYAAGRISTPTDWSIDFVVRSTQTRYYAPRTTLKPRPSGAQTALVTGAAGQEIWTNKYGEVKLHFYWDRYSQKNQDSSKWVRVSSAWAGSNFGGIHVPRIGTEVIVDFVNGDIDLPIVVGRVYNERNMPPWTLPDNATQSGILSRSSMGGDYANANAIRFEDKKGAEQVWIQAERNMDTVVENDETHHVMHDRTKTIDHDETVNVHHDRTETVDNNETITVHNNRQERVDVNETISIGANRTEDVGINETITIGANKTVTIGANKLQTIAIAYAQNVGAAKMTNVGAAYQINVGAEMSRTIGMFSTEDIGLSKTTTVGDGHSLTVASDQKIEVGGSQTISVTKNITITAGDSLELVCGKATIKMTSDGHITINGSEIDIGTSGNQILKADGDIVLKATNVKEN